VVIGFSRVTVRRAVTPPTQWDRIAADGGYADQSHLIREFREFTGGTPADILARSSPPAPREPTQPGRGLTIRSA
jgi:hypothetical protein